MKTVHWLGRDQVTWHQLSERLASHTSTFIWRSSWKRPTRTKTCSGIWRITIGPAHMFAEQKWRSWKQGWKEHWNIERGRIHSESWLMLPWLSMKHDGRPSLQISANLEKIFSFWKFWLQNRFFRPTRRATRRALIVGTPSGGKIDIFGFLMVIYACSGMAERFHQVLGGLKGQKHHENHLSATFCTSRKYSWKIEVLEGKMSSKLKNSTWVG